jgi:hypothetical protein
VRRLSELSSQTSGWFVVTATGSSWPGAAFMQDCPEAALGASQDLRIIVSQSAWPTSTSGQFRPFVGGSFLETMCGSVVTPVHLFRLSYALKRRAGPERCLHAPQALQ